MSDADPKFPPQMSSYLTTEHFTLQGARSIINGEIASRVSVYYTTLSSVIVAAAFIAQIPDLGEIFTLFAVMAFPLVILLGFFTVARLAVLGSMDFVYIKAISHIRQFYYQSTPEIEEFLLFPPFDDAHSLSIYAGWSTFPSLKDNLLSYANTVIISNSILTTTLAGIAAINTYSLSLKELIPYGIVFFILIFLLHGGFVLLFIREKQKINEYWDEKFPRPSTAQPAERENPPDD